MSAVTPKLTYADYLCYPADGNRHEIVGGDHYMNPAPSTYHQQIAQRLNHQLYTQIDLPGHGRVFFAPVDVQLGEHDIVQPDLLVVLAANRVISPSRIMGAPDHVVEILSPRSGNYDRKLKRSLYQRAGVKEYWIVDPEDAAVMQLVLTPAGYEIREHGDILLASYLPEVRVDLRNVW